MLGADSPRAGKSKKSNPVTKTPDLLPGHAQVRRVRCGKTNCRCARGEPHTAYYHAWDTDGVRFRRYVRKADVAQVRAACEAHRRLQAELRESRAGYRRTLALARALFRSMGL